MSHTATRRLAEEWARATAPVIETNLLETLDRVAKRNLNCTVAVSRELTKAKTPCLLSYYGGELFVFELTQRQAKTFHALNQTMECVEGGPSLSFAPMTPPVIDLSELSIEDADGLSGEQPVRGSLYYEMCGDATFPGTVVLAMEFALVNQCRKTLFYYPPQGLLPEGELQFTFPPAAPKQDKNGAGGFIGPIVAHVRFLGTMNPKVPGGHVPLSNTGAALVELI
jgi:hypothetical protein